jgi:farnesyl diphosphate synthase
MSLVVADNCAQWLFATLARIESGLAKVLALVDCPVALMQEAMAYAVLGKSKRLRPLLVYAVGEIFAAPINNLDVAAQAVELIHSYSLVHDDLPAMDNALLRRGKLSCFQAFGEDVAILAGDALHSLAFALLSDDSCSVDQATRLAMIKLLSQASGYAGMIGGQVLDILNSPVNNYQETMLVEMYQLKTGALFNASLQLGLLAANNHDKGAKDALATYAKYLSLAFQIQDDILDISNYADGSGKTSGNDSRQQKTTYPALFGVRESQIMVAELFTQAMAELDFFADRANYLRYLTTHFSNRSK